MHIFLRWCLFSGVGCFQDTEGMLPAQLTLCSQGPNPNPLEMRIGPMWKIIYRGKKKPKYKSHSYRRWRDLKSKRRVDRTNEMSEDWGVVFVFESNWLGVCVKLWSRKILWWNLNQWRTEGGSRRRDYFQQQERH